MEMPPQRQLAKLRTRESFLLNSQIPSGQGSGRVSLWIDGSIPLQFRLREAAFLTSSNAVVSRK